jgi:hypothetical protein
VWQILFENIMVCLENCDRISNDTFSAIKFSVKNFALWSFHDGWWWQKTRVRIPTGNNVFRENKHSSAVMYNFLTLCAVYVCWRR